MSIHSNTSYYTAIDSISPSSREHQTPSINNRIEEVAFNILFSQELSSNTEQLRFELIECKKNGSQYYTIVTWKDKRYRITVHDGKRKLAYSEADWQRVEHQTIKVLDKVQNGKHFFKGDLRLHAKTKNKWIVTYENNKPHLEHTVNKKIIRDFKKLFEEQIKSLNILPTTKPSQKPKRSSYLPLSFLDKPAKKKEPFSEFPKKVLEKIKDYLCSLKPNTNKQNTDIREIDREKSPLKRFKNHFFPSRRNIDDFDDLSSINTTSIKSFEEVNNEIEDDLEDTFSDNTSLGNISTLSSHVSSDSGAAYDPNIYPDKKP